MKLLGFDCAQVEPKAAQVLLGLVSGRHVALRHLGGILLNLLSLLLAGED